MRIRTESEAYEALADHLHSHVGWPDDGPSMVWRHGDDPDATYVFLTKNGDRRTLWQVGPRGGINRIWSLEGWQWDLLT